MDMDNLSEDDHQALIFQWANRNAKQHPRLGLLFAIPNGGKRDPRTAGKLKLTGVKAGVPDMFLPVACKRVRMRSWLGLFIELKKKDGKATELQKVWIGNLKFQGYRAEICVGHESAITVIKQYLDIP